MLDELHISDVALIREATFAPGPGLTVVTGETGAGKTALLSSLKLLAGERADAGMIREGQSSLSVEGRFYLDDSPEEGDVVARRFSVQGRSRISLGGVPSSVKELASRIGSSIDLCGQHEHQRLLNPKHQLALLDAWAKEEVSAPLAEYRSAYKAAAAAQAEFDRLNELAHESEVTLDRARYVVDQVDAVDPLPGEYDSLLAEMPRYEHAETILRELDFVRRSLKGDSGILDVLEQALGALDQVASLDASRAEDAAHLRDAFFTVEDVASQLSSYAQTIEFDPAELAARQERLANFQALMRGFGPRMEDVLRAYDEAVQTLREHDNCDELLEKAQTALDAAEAELARCAGELAQARACALPRFASLVGEQMARLQMGSAFISGEFEDLPRSQWSAQGTQGFQLLFAPGADMSPQPLNRIASGGELSRVMLACKVAIGDSDAAQTLVFDEIDAGVGGSTASALAEVLADLAKTHQVIVVTHLAQVAVKGEVHYLVRKSADGTPETSLSSLSGEERESEIARMLSGSVDELSLAHARALLQDA
ncbi:MAG: AAA family ATPase [Coriobacteriia bacterium]|nr:AAA family ATPase [Coriobacteriia bacterium]